ALQTAADILAGRTGLQTEKGVGEIVAQRVQLGWKIIALRLTLLIHQGSLFVALVHVVRDRPEVVEKLAVNGPALVALPDGRADQAFPLHLDGVAQREGALALVNDVAESFIKRSALVGGRCRRGEPALVDAATMRSQGVDILRSELDAAPRHQEPARHPRRPPTPQPPAHLADP